MSLNFRLKSDFEEIYSGNIQYKYPAEKLRFLKSKISLLNLMTLFKDILIALVIGLCIAALVYWYLNYFKKQKEGYKQLRVGVGKFNTILKRNIPEMIRFRLNKVCASPQSCDTSDLPDSFDCRTKWGPLLTTPLDQQKCGSCWAFATTTTISDRIRIHSRVGIHDIAFKENRWTEKVLTKTNARPLSRKFHYELGDFTAYNNISPYTFAACDICEVANAIDPEVSRYLRETENLCNMCCDGGIIQYAFVYMMIQGCISIGEDPDPWKYDCSEWGGSPSYKVKAVYNIEGQDNIKAEILNNGPVTTGFQVLSTFGYDEGKIPGTDIYGQYGTVIGGHAVCIMGWGSEHIPGGYIVNYWLCRNSWGPVWNKDGYFKIQMGICGIEDDVWGASTFEVYDIRRTSPKKRPNKVDLCNKDNGGVVDPS